MEFAAMQPRQDKLKSRVTVTMDQRSVETPGGPTRSALSVTRLSLRRRHALRRCVFARLGTYPTRGSGYLPEILLFTRSL